MRFIMTDTNQEQFNLDDIFGMSDEEISQLESSQLKDDVAEETTPTEPEDTQPPADVDVDTGAQEGEADDQANAEDGTNTSRSASEDEVIETDDAAGAGNQAAPSEDNPVDEPKEVEDVNAHKIAVYDTLMGTFKANGKPMQVNTPEEALALMQKGANYQKKMNELQPMRKVHKLLEQHGLLDMDKLALAIDLINKKPEAIAKLLEDSGIDAYNLPEANTYAPTDTHVADASIYLDDVVADLRSDEYGNRALNAILSEWDSASQAYFAENPTDMRVIATQMENGIYDKIMMQVSRERALGNIPLGTTDLQAYQAMGTYLHQQGAFNTVAKVTTKQPITTKVVAPKQEKTNVARKAAATPNGTVSPTEPSIEDIMSLSDADILKLMNKG